MFLDLEAYAVRELSQMGSYVEAMRECVTSLSTLLPTETGKSVKVKKDKELKNCEKEWTECVKLNLSKEETAMNIRRQQQFRREKLQELYKKSKILGVLVKEPQNGK